MYTRLICGSAISVVAIALASCSNATQQPMAQTKSPSPAPQSTEGATKPAVPAEPKFRADLFEKSLRSAAAFRGTKETADPLIDELRFLELQKLSKDEKTVRDIFSSLAELQVKMIKLEELKGASENFVKEALKSLVAARAGAEYTQLYTEAVDMRSKGKIIVGSKFPVLQEWEGVVTPTVSYLNLKSFPGDAGGKYVAYEDTKQSLKLAAQACLETAADMINNGGKVTAGR
jgi:hypothetical protein